MRVNVKEQSARLFLADRKQKKRKKKRKRELILD